MFRGCSHRVCRHPISPVSNPWSSYSPWSIYLPCCSLAASVDLFGKLACESDSQLHELLLITSILDLGPRNSYKPAAFMVVQGSSWHYCLSSCDALRRLAVFLDKARWYGGQYGAWRTLECSSGSTARASPACCTSPTYPVSMSGTLMCVVAPVHMILVPATVFTSSTSCGLIGEATQAVLLPRRCPPISFLLATTLDKFTAHPVCKPLL